MSSDHDPANGHGDAHGDAHGGHDDHAVATDVIPESSPQDMILKLVAVTGAFLIIVAFGGWWWMQPLPEGGEGHGESHGGEASEHVEHAEH